MKLKGISKKVKHTKSNAQTFEIILQFHTAKQLNSSLQGQYVFWAWKRGHHSGTTLKTAVEKTGATWDDSSINLQCSMFVSSKDPKQFDSKILEINLKENDAKKKKKSVIGKTSIDLAKYASSCTGEEFVSHFLTVELTGEGKQRSAVLSATLKVRRDPTGTLYGTSNMSVGASHNSISANDYDDEIDSSFEASGDDEAITAPPATQRTPRTPKSARAARKASSRRSTPDDDKQRTPGTGGSTTTNNNTTSSSSSSRKRSDAEMRDLRASTPAVSSRRVVSSDNLLPRSPTGSRKRTSRKPSDTTLGAFTPPPRRRSPGKTPRDDGLDFVAPSALRTTSSNPDVTRSNSNNSIDDPAPASPSSSSAARPISPTTSFTRSQPIDSPSALRRRISQQNLSVSPPERRQSMRDDVMGLTRMESIRSDNLRKYGQRRQRGDNSAASPTNTPPSSCGVVMEESANSAKDVKLREQEAELDRLKLALNSKSREDDFRFFVEEAIVFAEPNYTDDGVPLSVLIIHKTLLHWDAFTPPHNEFLSSIIDAFEKVLKRNQQNREVLLYWLATLALLAQRLGASGDDSDAEGGTAAGSSASGASAGGTPVVRRHATASATTAPQLSAFVASTRDTAAAYFARCVDLLLQQTDTLLVPALLEGDMNHPERNAAPHARLLAVLADWHAAATANNRVPAPLVTALFASSFEQFGVRLLNALLERRDLCSCGNGLQTKMHTSALLEWASRTAKLDLHSQLAPVLQAADVLVMNKTTLLEASTRANACPELNAAQLHRLLTIYTPDEFDPDAVHPGVLREIGQLARTCTQPMHRRVPAVRLSLTRLPPLRPFDNADPPLDKLPPTLKSRPGLAFLLTDSPITLQNDDDDAPW